MAVLGHQIGEELIAALGLPKHTCAFTLRCAVDEIVSVECEYYPEMKGGHTLDIVLSRYELVERPKPRAAAPRNFDAWLTARKEASHADLLRTYCRLSRMDERLLCRG